MIDLTAPPAAQLPVTGDRRSRSRITWLLVAMIAWLSMVVGAMALLWRYKTTPGAVGALQSQWPAASTLTRATDRPTLLMFAHPMCPCTEASLAELRKLMSGFTGQVDARIIMIHPAVLDEEWAPEAFVREASAISGVRVWEDAQGREADLFGAKTSGHVVLYDTTGRLLFSGGITGARGHEGDNAGVSQLRALLSGQAKGPAGAPIFGCSLEDPDPKGS